MDAGRKEGRAVGGGVTYLHGGCGKVAGRKEGAGGEMGCGWAADGSVLSADEYTRSNNSGTISLFRHAPFLIFSRQHPLLSVGDRFLSTSIHRHSHKMVAARKRSPTPEAQDAFELPEDYKPYVPVAKRRAQMLSQLGAKHSAKKVKTQEELEKEMEEELKEQAEDEERAREKARRERTLLQAAQEVKEQRALEGLCCSRVFVLCTDFLFRRKEKCG